MGFSAFIGKQLERLVRKYEFFGQRMIEVDEEWYLLRVYLLPRYDKASYYPGLYLHRFFRSDKDRELHNHPWEFALSFILSGGYQEERLVDGEVQVFDRKPFTFNIIRGDDFHRVRLNNEEEGCWTLFMSFNKYKSWGFLDATTNKFIHWRAFIEAKGERVVNGDYAIKPGQVWPNR